MKPWIVVLIIFLFVGVVYAYNNPTFFDSVKNNIPSLNPSEQKCKQAINDKVKFLNEKYSPKGVVTMPDFKKFDDIELANNFIAQWKTNVNLYSLDYRSAENALNVIKNITSPFYIGVIKTAGSENYPYILTSMYFVVCETDGTPISSTIDNLT